VIAVEWLCRLPHPFDRFALRWCQLDISLPPHITTISSLYLPCRGIHLPYLSSRLPPPHRTQRTKTNPYRPSYSHHPLTNFTTVGGLSAEEECTRDAETTALHPPHRPTCRIPLPQLTQNTPPRAATHHSLGKSLNLAVTQSLIPPLITVDSLLTKIKKVLAPDTALHTTSCPTSHTAGKEADPLPNLLQPSPPLSSHRAGVT